MSIDLHGNLSIQKALNAEARATNVATTGDILDLQNFAACEFAFLSGTITDGSFACSLEHGDQPTLSDAAAVTADELIGAAPSFAATDDNTVRKVGYRRVKRYVRAVVTQSGATSGGTVGAVAILGAPRIGPVA